jgi:hypothetical protein
MMSREERLKEIPMFVDEDRVQYDGKDGERTAMYAQAVTTNCIDVITALGGYRDVLAEADTSPEEVSEARRNVVEAWANLQVATSGVAWGLRIDGDDAFGRVVESMKNDTPLDMRGL